MDGRPQTYLAVLPCLVVAILEAHQLCWLEKKDKSKSLRNYSISFWGKKNTQNLGFSMFWSLINILNGIVEFKKVAG